MEGAELVLVGYDIFRYDPERAICEDEQIIEVEISNFLILLLVVLDVSNEDVDEIPEIGLVEIPMQV
jgi:hypothetical protein